MFLRILFLLLTLNYFNVFTQTVKVSGQISGDIFKGNKYYLILDQQESIAIDSLFNFTFNSNKGKHSLHVLCVNCDTIPIWYQFNNDTTIHIPVFKKSIKLATITIARDKNLEIENEIIISNQTIDRIPALLGEKDPIKSTEIIPGIKSREGTVGISIRGGQSDDNLFILDGVEVYNPFHLYGVFSAFNNNIIKEVTINKSYIPSEYGLKNSGLFALNTHESTDSNKIKGELGFLSSNLTVTAKKKKVFLLSSVRLSNHFLYQPFLNQENTQSAFRFNDIFNKLQFQISPKSKLFINSFLASNQLKIYEKFEYQNHTIENYWQTGSHSIHYQTKLSKTDVSAILSCSHYSFNYIYNFKLNQEFINRIRNTINISNDLTSNIIDYGAKLLFKNSFNYIKLSYGLEFKNHNLNLLQKRLLTKPENEFFKEETKVTTIQMANVYSAFMDSKILKEKYTLDFGLRLNILGNINNTPWLEPRVYFKRKINKTTNFNASYARKTQTIKSVPRNDLTSAFSFLLISENNNISKSNSFDIGFSKIVKDFLKIRSEIYYTYTTDFAMFKEGTNLYNFNQFDQSSFSSNQILTLGTMKNYGWENSIHFEKNKFSGILSYTISYSLLDFESLNRGNTFYSNNDNRHDIHIWLTHQITPKINISLSWLYRTGNRFTIPSYILQEGIVDNSFVLNSSRNSNYIENLNGFIAPAYHRLDCSVDYKTTKKYYTKTLTFGIYNTYNSQNATFYIYETSYNVNNDALNSLQRVTILPFFPYLKMSFNFTPKLIQ